VANKARQNGADFFTITIQAHPSVPLSKGKPTFPLGQVRPPASGLVGDGYFYTIFKILLAGHRLPV
jgi:hypothetical protein